MLLGDTTGCVIDVQFHTMSDEVISTPTVEAAPAPVAVEAAPVVIETPAQAPTEAAPVAAEPPSVEAAPVATTVLGADAKIPEAPVEVKAEPVVAEVKNEEQVSQSDEPAPLPSFDPWVLPEGFQADPERMGEFNKDLAEFALEAKVDSKLLQGLGQKLVDRHLSEVQAVAQKVAEAYDKVWKDQTKSWLEAFQKDPEIGGNRQETTAAAAREFINKHGGTPEQQVELRTVLEQTGLGNHPALIRVFAKANSNLAEGKFVPAAKPPVSQNVSRKTKFYGSKA